MREIKFRAWDGSKMYTFDNHAFDLIYNDISGWNVAPNLPCEQLRGMKWTTGESSDSAKDFQLMQFTGLKDKNSKEIYEGDILKDKYAAGTFEIRFGEFCHNEINFTGFFFSDLHPFGKANSDDSYEVIGNIYENPELLNP